MANHNEGSGTIRLPDLLQALPGEAQPGPELSITAAADLAADLLTKSFRARSVYPAVGQSKALTWDEAAEDRFEWMYDAHKHAFMEICICLEGQCAIQLDEHYYEMNPGDACVIMPDVMHNELPNRHMPYRALWLATDFQRIVAHVFYRDSKHQLKAFEGGQFEAGIDCSFVLHSLKRECAGEENRRFELLKSYVLQTVVYASRQMSAHTGGQRRGHWRDTIVKQIWQYVERHIHRHIRLSEISQELCVSINHLNNLFKAETGQTITQYIEEYKIRKAKELLRDTTEPIQAIAASLGFYDQYHFSKIFKKETGATPTQYRKNN